MKYQKGFITGPISTFSMVGWILVLIGSGLIYFGGKAMYNKITEKETEIVGLKEAVASNEAAFKEFKSSFTESQRRISVLETQSSKILEESRKRTNAITGADLRKEGIADPVDLEARINAASDIQIDQFRMITDPAWNPNAPVVPVEEGEEQ